MPPYDDYSDSDESDVEDVQTNVLLGLPDGPIFSASDLANPRISRIGGHPVYPSGIPAPPLSVSRCQSCSEPMELLVQLWCPFESSAYDRTLHIWGCSHTRCQRKKGSVKVIRALRYNPKYAAKLEVKRLKEAARTAAAPKHSTANPFSSNTTLAGTQFFGGGFCDDDEVAAEGDTGGPPSGDPSSASDDESERDGNIIHSGILSSASANVAAVTLALQGASISQTKEKSTPETTSVITAVPSHPPIYLDTLFEYIAGDNVTARKNKKTNEQQESGSGAPENQWALETYERTQGIDDVFARFVSRVEREPQQCIRYDLSGVPLPFASDVIYKRLFPFAHSVAPAPGTRVIATGGNEGAPAGVSDGSGKRVYDPTIIPPCESCGGPRAFECQLMPNLINVLRQARRAREDPDTGDGRKKKKTQTDEERRASVARLLRGEANDSRDEAAEYGDMEWGTCIVFSCAQNCCRTKSANGNWSEAQVVWKDEYVLIQWDA